ncbi:hypothetical protein LO27_13425 [Salmonella enterica]|nr:hypothetical protein [Salmonella enterica]EAX7749044.1 hypothetical protein [Salmonella enterica]EAX7760581.1 hypothetical protein [Salmonella enterica]EBP1125804.1 hypothetical protein [Salmonella enterica]EBP1190526.1 hypothetical protein [Salmonella enterica]
MLVTDLTSDSADSYAGVGDLRHYAGLRGYSVPEDDASCETLLIKAMDYLAGMPWCGEKAERGQPLDWPRCDVCVDGAILQDGLLPKRVVDAQCRLAVEAQSVDLQPTLNGEADILSESIAGAVAVTYDPDSAGTPPSFPWLDTILRGLVENGGGINFDVMRG